MMNWLEKVNKYVSLITGTLTLLFGVYFLFLNERLKVVGQNLENANKRIENLAKSVELELDKQKFRNDIRFRIYSEVKDAMDKEKDAKAQRATKAIIDIMLAEDLEFRNKMYDILTVSLYVDTSVAKNIIKTRMVEKELINEIENNKVTLLSNSNNELKSSDTKVKPAETNRNVKIRVDVFYLEDIIAESEPRAERIVRLLNSDSNGRYKAIMRILPRSINAKEGYKISSNQIRFEVEEAAIAEDIAKLIEKANIFQLEKPELRNIQYRTPNYISVFVRNM